MKDLVIEGLVDSAAPHPSGLAAANVDILVQNARSVIGDDHGLGGGDLLVDVGTGSLVKGFQLILSCHVPVKDVLLEAGNGVVGAAHALDLFTAAVGGTGVGHGVTSVTVGDVLEDQRAVAVNGVFLGVLDGGLCGKDVHGVDLQTGDVLATLVVVGQSGGTSSGSTHTVLVVYHHVNTYSNVKLRAQSLLSQPKIAGRFHSLAMLKDSKT